jgi:glycosyltransferase involved in cell wall biosynthesis
MHASNFRKLKRIPDVMNIFKEVHNKIPSKLMLVGDGPDRPAAEDLCRELNLCDDVRFVGKQDRWKISWPLLTYSCFHPNMKVLD